MLARKYRIHIFLALLALAIIVYPHYRRSNPGQQHIDASGAVASRFLNLVDRQHYEQSWMVCANQLKDMVPLKQWQQQLASARNATGPLQERLQRNFSYTDEAKKGVPEGEYMVYSYVSAFLNKTNVKETVTLLLCPDGNWRVVGYFID